MNGYFLHVHCGSKFCDSSTTSNLVYHYRSVTHCQCQSNHHSQWQINHFQRHLEMKAEVLMSEIGKSLHEIHSRPFDCDWLKLSNFRRQSLAKTKSKNCDLHCVQLLILVVVVTEAVGVWLKKKTIIYLSRIIDRKSVFYQMNQMNGHWNPSELGICTKWQRCSS